MGFSPSRVQKLNQRVETTTCGAGCRSRKRRNNVPAPHAQYELTVPWVCLLIGSESVNICDPTWCRRRYVNDRCHRSAALATVS